MGRVADLAEQLTLSTFSTRRLGHLVVWVGRLDVDISDADWAIYVAWLKELQQAIGEVKVLTTQGRAPSSSQRSLIDRELNTEQLRIAVMLSNPALVSIVRVTSWFIKSVAAFKQNELEKALAFLGENDFAAVRTAIRDLGGVVAKAR